jgi:Polyketide cyclase / dehydrase and lipid transport
MSLCRRQGFIEAPVATVWELISDVGRHPEWWPRVVEVECEELEEGCTYREVVRGPFGDDEMEMLIEDRDEYRHLNIRCVNTGTFVRFGLTEARGGTFLDGEMGMDPTGLATRVFDAVAGRRYFSKWMASTLEALREAAKKRYDSGEMGDPGLEPGTSSLLDHPSGGGPGKRDHE